MMPSDDRSKRLATLRDAETRGALTSEEIAELGALLDELDAEEERATRAVAEQRERELVSKREELERTRSVARELERVLDSQRALLTEAQDYLVRLRARRMALAEEARDALRRTGTEG